MKFYKCVIVEICILLICLLIFVLVLFYQNSLIVGDSEFCGNRGCKLGVGYILGGCAIGIIATIWNIIYKWKNYLH